MALATSPHVRSAKATAPRLVGRDAHGPGAPDEGSAIRAVAVADQVAWRLVPAAGLGQLRGKPFQHWDGLSTQP
jgi:hypothetical protein